MQAGGGLIQDVERAAGVALAEFQRQLDALRFTTRQCGGSLPQLDVTQAHIQQGLQLARNGGHRLQELERGFHRQVEDLSNVFPLVQHLKRLAVVALPGTDIARHIHIGQKVHLHLHHSVALASLAAPTRHVEGKAARAIAALAGGGYFGHQLANRREQTGVGGRIGARRAANRRLVHIDDFVEMLDAFNRLMPCRLFVGTVNGAGYCSVQRVIHQGRFSRAGDPGHAGEQPHRKVDTHVLQVMALSTHYTQGLQFSQRGLVVGFALGPPYRGRAGGIALRLVRGLVGLAVHRGQPWRAAFRDRDLQGLRQVLAGE